MTESPCAACATCGACCAGSRVSFYLSGGDDPPGGWMPPAFTRRLTPHLRLMRGTDRA